jgi:phosphopantetheine--protein transferase-like protein
MLYGIGTDILHVKRIAVLNGNYDDPFFKKTFTADERKQAKRRSDPDIYFATRFAAKEAVFKCFGIDGNRIRLNDIEIMTLTTGALKVKLHGKLRVAAKKLGIDTIMVSLSWDGEYALAFAVAQGARNASTSG